MDKPSFSVIDYIVFVGCLVAYAGIGLYFALFGGRQRTTDEVLLGNKKFGIFPVTMALLASFMSAISLLGYPAEIYVYGTMLFWFAGVYCLAYPISAYLFLPVFYNLNLTSGYQVLWMTPLNSSVIELSMTASIMITGLLAAFYTSIGGAKAVVYTNTMQMILIFGGLLAVVAGGSMFLGGLGNVWQLAKNGGRIHFNDFRLDPTVRHSVWSLMIGGTFTLLTMFAANQMTIQRYISMKSLPRAQCALLLNVPFNIAVLVLYLLCGLILYATYANCDPVFDKKIQKNDQLLPYYVMDQLREVIGLPGLFVSALYGAGLSTLSGGFNSIAAVILEDFIKPVYSWKNSQEIDDKIAAILSRILALLFGLITVGMAFFFDFVKTTVLQIALSIFGIVGGPLLGVFCLGMLVPWANKWGALIGQILSLLVTCWIGFGAIANKITPVRLQFGMDCGNNESDWSNLTSVESKLFNVDKFGTVFSTNGENNSLSGVYSISYQYYSLIGVAVTLLVGTVFSGLTGFSDPKIMDWKLFIPVYRKLFCCCPNRCRQMAKCGIDFEADVSVAEECVTDTVIRKHDDGNSTDMGKEDNEYEHMPLKLTFELEPEMA